MEKICLNDEQYMQLALEEARAALQTADVPVGAVLVETATGAILATGHNTREADSRITGHAELNAITAASERRRSYRMEDCTLYVTLEPCPMCTGAILQARVGRVVFGASDPVAGAMGSVWALHRHPASATHTAVEGGCMAQDCRILLQNFFRERRQRTLVDE